MIPEDQPQLKIKISWKCSDIDVSFVQIKKNNNKILDHGPPQLKIKVLYYEKVVTFCCYHNILTTIAV